jgi:predicted nucleotidyltransferase/DNA-binding CsgD family transcriptional regulator
MNNQIFTTKTKQIIAQLLKGEKSLTELSNIIGISKPTILKYLNNLEEIGIISSKIIITAIGREKRYSISAFSQVMNLDPTKGLITFSINEPLNFDFPLVGQIPQQKFRNSVKINLEQILEKSKSKLSLIVYGSIARGEATAKSDLDLLVLCSNKWNNKSKNMLMDALYESVLSTQIQVKPLFKNLNEFIKKDDTITKQIKKEGIIIHDSLGSEKLWKTMQRYWNITN